MSSLVPALKQQFNELINGKSQTEIKNRTYYFYNNIISKFSHQTCQKLTKNITKALVFTISDTLQLKKLVIVKIFSVNPLHLLANHASGYIEEKNGNKYLIFDDSVNENKGLLKNTQMFGMELKMKPKQ